MDTSFVVLHADHDKYFMHSPHFYTVYRIWIHNVLCNVLFMWEEGINSKPQIYYNNNNAGTPQASKRKKKAIQIEKWKTHTQNK